MANTRKKTTEVATTEVVEEIEVKETKKTTKKNDDELTAILAQMKAMQEQIEKLSKEKDIADKIIESFQSKKEEELSQDEDILVISQTVGLLTLSTKGDGNGTLYSFPEFGYSQEIPFYDLKEICRNMPNFAQQGIFYIVNKQAVDKLRLTNYYNRILSNEDMLNLFEKDSETIVELFKLASELQKKQIIGLIEDKIINKENIDLNVLREIDELAGTILVEKVTR